MVLFMDLDALAKSPVGRLISITPPTDADEDYAYAFLPNPLEQQILLDQATLIRVANASAALGMLEASLKRMSDPGVLSRPAIWREAISSSAMEGTYAPFATVASSVVDKKRSSDETRQIWNYRETLENAVEALRTQRVTQHLVCSMQQSLLSKTSEDSPQSGKLRTEQVVIGDQRNLKSARLVPCPPGDQLQQLWDSLFEWINRAPDEFGHPLIDVALTHYQFETIHPFHNGNGRIGRMLISLQLQQAGILSEPVLSLSTGFAQDKGRYKDELLAMSCNGDFNRWVSYFCEAINDHTPRMIQAIDALANYRTDIYDVLHQQKRTGVIFRVVDELFANPAVTAPGVARLFSIDDKAARKILNTLMDIGLVEPGIAERPQIYLATRVIEIIETQAFAD